jgi:3-mercaptopyruvate sulfurtransferase SseA
MLSRRQSAVVVAATLVLAFAVAPQARAAKKEQKMPEPEPFGRFTVDQVERRLGQANVHVYDGNSPETYAQNHLPGAVLLNSKDIKEGVLPADKNTTLIFYCANEL